MKLKWNRMLVVPLLIAVVGGWLLWPHSNPKAGWFNEGWLYRKKITVTNNTSTETNKYVTLSSFDTSDSTRFQTDCGDVRFIKQNGEVLPYYVVSGCATSSTSFHINFDTLTAGAQDIYIYYGNATVANGGATADFASAATNATVGSPATEEVGPGPIGYWKFDEGVDNTCSGGTNDACDSTPQQNDLALSGASWKTEDNCIAGKCALFDGTNDYLQRAGGVGGNAAAFVQECSNSATNTTTVSVTCSTTGGNLVVVMFEANTGPTRTFAVNDSAGNTYTECTSCRHQTSSIQNTGETWYSLTTSPATSIGVTWSGGSSSISVSAEEFSGISASPYDTFAMNFDDSNSTSITSGTTPTTIQTYEMAVGYLGISSASTLTGTTAGWTYNTTQTGTATAIKSAYQKLNSATSVSIGGTAGTAGRWTSAIATFKANTGVAGDAELDPGTGSFTISGWFKHPSTISGTDTIISRADGVNGVGYKLYYDATNGVCFGIDQTAGSFPVDSACTTTSYADNQWHHIDGVKSGTSSITLYIDGKQVAQDSSITSSSISGNGSSLYIGIDADGTSNPWHGFIDEVKYYGYARTADQIKTDAVRPAGQNDMGNSAVVGQGSNDFLNKGVVGYWKFDESATGGCAGGTNDSCDSSGNLNDGDWTNGATFTTAARFGNAVTLDGTNDYVNVADNDSLSPTDITLSTWIKMTALPSVAGEDEMIMRKSHGSSPFNAYHWYVRQADNKLRFEWYQSDGSVNNISGNTALTAGTWYHVVFSKTGTTGRIFINGVVDVEVKTMTDSTYNSSGPLRIGSNGSTANFYGQIDESRIYNRGLSPSEVAALYNWGPGPVGYWKLDENTGTTISDSSGVGGTSSTFTGTTSWQAGKFGSSMYFTGDNSVIRIPETTSTDLGAATDSYTVSAWVKTIGTTGNRVVVGKMDYNDSSLAPFYIIVDNTNYVCFNIDSGTNPSACTPNNTLSANVWHYLTGVRDVIADKIYIYVDGVLQGSAVDTTSGSMKNNYDIAIGNGGNTYNQWDFKGNIDEVKIYNYARTPAQIIEDMNAGHPVGGSPVGSQVGYWKFDEGALNTCSGGTNDFCDSSINVNDLAFSGTAGGITLSGKFNKAFDGNAARWASRADDDDFDFAAADDFTLSAWIKTDGTASGTQYILNKSSATSQGYGIYGSSSGTVVFAIDDDTSWTPDDQAQSTTNVFDQAWHYIAARKTGTSKIDIFVDGRLEGSDTSLGATGSLSNAVSFYVGDRDGTDNGDEFNGDVDEVKIYRGALTDEQIKLDYNRGSAAVFGSSSTASDGITADNSATREYCVPGDTTSCNSPLIDFKFDENTGGTSTYDTSGNGYVGAFNGTMTSANWTRGKQGSTVLFDTTDDNVIISNASALVPTRYMTLSAWVKFDQFSGTDQRFIRKFCASAVCGGNSSYILELDGPTEGIRFHVHTGGGAGSLSFAATANNAVTTNTWYHITGVYNSSGLWVYINGVNKTSTLANPAADVNGDSNVLRFGAHTTSSSPLLGKMDRVLLYDYARSPAQIAWDYNRGNPVAHYKFDECSGTTLYNSVLDGNGQAIGNNGTITIGATGSNTSAGTCTGASTEAWKNGANGKIGSSLDFDGSNDYVNIGAVTDLNPTTNGFSISTWAKATAWPSAIQMLTAKYTSGLNGEYYFGIFSNKARAILVGTGGTKISNSSSTLTDNTWTHFVVTWSGVAADPLLIYINGKLDTSTEQNDSLTAFSTAVQGTYIATRNSAASAFFDGQIDDMRFYNYPLTSTQIKTLYNNSAAALVAPITGSP